jgi:hypothetical protein
MVVGRYIANGLYAVGGVVVWIPAQPAKTSDSPAAEVGVRGDRGDACLGQLSARVEVGQVVPGGLQLGQPAG